MTFEHLTVYIKKTSLAMKLQAKRFEPHKLNKYFYLIKIKYGNITTLQIV